MHRKLLWFGGTLVLCAQLALSRAGEPSVAVADMEQIFKEHRQLKQTVAQLNEQNVKQAEERKQMVADLDRLQRELRQLNADALLATLPEAERLQRAAKAEAKLHEARVAEARVMRFDEATRRQLTTRLQEVRQQYFGEVQTQIRAYAAEKHIALVLDSSSMMTQGGIGGVLHADAQLDITAAIIARVNAAQPAAPQK
jgi:Skp family chaperone for outer membrane proteins